MHWMLFYWKLNGKQKLMLVRCRSYNLEISEAII